VVFVDELSPRRRLLILAICCMSLLIVVMDTTIVNVALPSIRADLNASVSGLQWTVDAYTVTLASLLILAGSTADRIGRRRTFQSGLVLFSVGSLLCSVAPSLTWLIVFRIVQAAGGSMLNPVAMSIITNVFTEPRERARAIGVWGGVVGISLGMGPVLGGLLTETVGWRAIFWVNVPIGIAAIVLAALFIPESRAARARRVDPLGQLLVIVALGTLTYGIIGGPEAGWTSGRTLSMFAVAAGALIVLIAVERHRFEPLVELRLFRSRPFTGATTIAVLSFGAFAGYLFVLSLYLQDVRGLSPLHAGLTLLPLALITLIAAPVSGRLVGAYGPRSSLFIATPMLALGSLALFGLDEHTSYLRLVLALTVFGIGFGFVNSPITNTAVSGLPRSQAGVAAAFASTSRQVGSSLGVALVGSLVNPIHGGSVSTSFARSGNEVWITIAAMGAVAFVVAVISTSRRARVSAERTAEQLRELEVAV
jgi:EmrB/QacA subfamily drug resistance transporter